MLSFIIVAILLLPKEVRIQREKQDGLDTTRARSDVKGVTAWR